MGRYRQEDGVIQYVREVSNKSLPDNVLVSILFESGDNKIIRLGEYGWLSSYISKNGTQKVESTDDLRDELFGEAVTGVFNGDDLKCFVKRDSKRAEYFNDYQNESEQSSTTT